MIEIFIIGESYFDREIIKFIVQKYKGDSFYFNLIDKHTNKSSVLKDFNKYRRFVKESKKANIDRYIIFSFDLDFEGDCITSCLEKNKIFPQKFSDNFLLSIQVREIESWILSDSQGLSNWTGITESKFRQCNSDFLIREKPTITFLNIISRNSEKFRKKLCNSDNFTKKSDYYSEELLENFIPNYFSPERARRNNKSLDRFIRKLENL
jgi:hypothetical protein